jgi:hypothetical protein
MPMSVPQTKISNGRIIVNNELEGVWKKVVTAYQGTQENQEAPKSRYPAPWTTFKSRTS